MDSHKRSCHIKYISDRRFRGASPVYPTPRNREIGFVSSSFSFRACRACRAWRGEAVRAHVRPLFLPLGLPGARIDVCPCPSAVFGVNILCAGAWVLIEFERFLWAGGLFYITKTMGFKKIENAAYSICMGFNR